MPRKYELHACPRCNKRLLRGTESCVDGHVNTHAVAVTAIDQRDVEPLVEAARRAEKALGDFAPADDLRAALKPFEDEEGSG